MWIFPGYFLLTVKTGKGKRLVVCRLPSLTYPEENCRTISFTPWLSFLQLLPGLPRPMAGMKLEEDTTGHQRMDIKRRARLDPAAIVRCGRSHSQQALRSFNTVTGASGLLDTVALHISPLGGHVRKSIWRTTGVLANVRLPRASKHAQDISVSSGGGVDKRTLFIV